MGPSFGAASFLIMTIGEYDLVLVDTPEALHFYLKFRNIYHTFTS